MNRHQTCLPPSLCTTKLPPSARACVRTTPARYERLGSALLSHDGVQAAAITAARSQLRPVVKHYQVLATDERFDGLDPVDVHDGGAVNPAERGGIECGCDVAQVLAQQVGSTTH